MYLDLHQRMRKSNFAAVDRTIAGSFQDREEGSEVWVHDDPVRYFLFKHSVSLNVLRCATYERTFAESILQTKSLLGPVSLVRAEWMTFSASSFTRATMEG